MGNLPTESGLDYFLKHPEKKNWGFTLTKVFFNDVMLLKIKFPDYVIGRKNNKEVLLVLV